MGLTLRERERLYAAVIASEGTHSCQDIATAVEQVIAERDRQLRLEVLELQKTVSASLQLVEQLVSTLRQLRQRLDVTIERDNGDARGAVGTIHYRRRPWDAELKLIDSALASAVQTK